MLKKGTRESYLLDELRKTGRLSTNEVVEMLAVSEATARRIFSNLEKNGKVVRNYGGIQIANHPTDYSFETSEKIHIVEKRRIGRLAASFVEDGDAVYLDCGTTLFQMMLALGERIAANELRTLNIITNSVANLQAFPPTLSGAMILVGGQYNFERRDFSGTLTESYAAPFHFSKCFLGCDGVAAQIGFSTDNFSVSSLNNSVLKNSDSVYILADSSKFNKASLVSYARFGEVTGVVTDAVPHGDLQRALEEAETPVYLASAER